MAFISVYKYLVGFRRPTSIDSTIQLAHVIESRISERESTGRHRICSPLIVGPSIHPRRVGGSANIDAGRIRSKGKLSCLKDPIVPALFHWYRIKVGRYWVHYQRQDHAIDSANALLPRVP